MNVIRLHSINYLILFFEGKKRKKIVNLGTGSFIKQSLELRTEVS